MSRETCPRQGAARKARVPEKLVWHFFEYFPWEDAGVREWIIKRYLRIRTTSQYHGEYQRRPGPEETVQ